LRWARALARWDLWRTNNHPDALVDAAAIYLASGRPQQALAYAESCHTAVKLQSHHPSDAAYWSRVAAEVAIVATCHLRNRARTPDEQQQLGENARTWMRELAKLDLDALAALEQNPVLRDLSSYANSLLPLNRRSRP
jgi:hypothetical protein